MSLIIAWRNPLPPARAARRVRRVVEHRFGVSGHRARCHTGIFRALFGRQDDKMRPVLECGGVGQYARQQYDSGGQR